MGDYPNNLESLNGLTVTAVYNYDCRSHSEGLDDGVTIEFSDGRTLCVGYYVTEGSTRLFEKDEQINGRK